MGTTSESLQSNLNVFLQQYRKAPHTETGESPAKLFLGRNIRTRLDLVRPKNVNTDITEKQAKFDPSFRTFVPGQQVYFISGNSRMDKWIPGVIISRLGDLHYEISNKEKRLKRHVDQIKCYEGNELTHTTSNGTEFSTLASGENTRRVRYYGSSMTSQEQTAGNSSSLSVPANSPEEQFVTPSTSPNRSNEIHLPALRRTGRLRRAPLRYSP
ncbi:uncharacterized protein LOC131427205 [Malaya genurostris]|uniref:uncharacterized protein LOC131427205 n=1 Tax=Malaya genurostris TaxID=325434 RepID=UPI0026F3ECDC|nr:uncharacterized protein LOC131427205 [Malaya genurostris]